MWFESDVIIQWNVTLTQTYLMGFPILGCAAAASFISVQNNSDSERKEKGRGSHSHSVHCDSVLQGISILSISQRVWDKSVLICLSFSIFLFLPFRGEHQNTQNYILGAVIHKQCPQITQAQIIWWPAPQELAAVGMTACIHTPCCTTAQCGLTVLIKAILITSS